MDESDSFHDAGLICSPKKATPVFCSSCGGECDDGSGQFYGIGREFQKGYDVREILQHGGDLIVGHGQLGRELADHRRISIKAVGDGLKISIACGVAQLDELVLLFGTRTFPVGEPVIVVVIERTKCSCNLRKFRIAICGSHASSFVSEIELVGHLLIDWHGLGKLISVGLELSDYGTDGGHIKGHTLF